MFCFIGLQRLVLINYKTTLSSFQIVVPPLPSKALKRQLPFRSVEKSDQILCITYQFYTSGHSDYSGTTMAFSTNLSSRTEDRVSKLLLESKLKRFGKNKKKENLRDYRPLPKAQAKRESLVHVTKKL